MLAVSSIIGLICLGLCHGSTLSDEVEYLLSSGDQLDFEGATDLILLLGSSGVGKSTLAKFITHNPSLHSVKIGSSYVFTDNGTISTVTSKSMTLLPNIYRDAESGLVLVDCPGFSDTREPKFEIAASYFVKKVMEDAKRLKIILAENHFSLIEGADRFGFKRLLKHISELIPNISHFKGSMSLIATKVINQGIPDDEEKADVLSFINTFAEDVRNDISTNKQNVSFTKTSEAILKTINVLLNDGSGENIALFRKPNRAGSPWDSSILQKCYADIRDLIFNRTAWVDNANQKYRYTLTTDSIVFIKDRLVPNNNKNAMTEIIKILSAFSASVNTKLNSPELNIEQKIALGSILKNQFSEILNQMSTVKELSLLTESLSKIATIHGIEPKALKNFIFKAEFFHDVGGINILAFLNEAKKELGKTSDALGNIQLFYQFLQALRLKLDEYEPQSVRHISYRQITINDFRNFIYDSSKFNIEVQNKDQLLAMPMTEYMITDLNRILNAALNYKVNLVHNQQTKHLLMEARNLMASEVNAKLGAYPGLDTLTVIAAKNFFVDSNLAVTNTHVNIVSPRVLVVGTAKEILLRGSDAGPYPGKAADSTAVAVPGVGGHAGYPGQNGGNFVMVAMDVINPALLTVKSIGGNGGKGQLGGNGQQGVASGYPTLGEIILPSQGDVDNHARNQGYGVERIGDYMVVINQKENVLPSAGGSGGVGGVGGLPGQVTIKIKNHASGNLIKVVQAIGEMGEGGDGGAGGVGLSQCARKHYSCRVHEEHGRCGPWWRRVGCLKHRDYRCYPNNLDNCGNYPNAGAGGKGTSKVGFQTNYPVAPIAYGQLWHNMNERLGPFQQVGPEYGEMHQYAQHAVNKS